MTMTTMMMIWIWTLLKPSCSHSFVRPTTEIPVPTHPLNFCVDDVAVDLPLSDSIRVCILD